MAIVAGIFGIIGRYTGKLLTTLLGWASTLLFGKVPADKQLIVVTITFGSIAWLALVAGVIVPDVGTFLLGFVAVPDWVDPLWVRLAMLVAALVLPLVIGATTLLLLPAGARPGGRALLAHVARGYLLVTLLGLSLGLLAIIAGVLKIRSLAKRWSDAHVPVIVKPGCYDEVVADLEAALDAAELRVSRRDAPRALALPGRLLGRVAGAGVMSLVPDRLVQLVGDDLEVGVYPADVAISGSKDRVARARAALATRLTATEAYLTTTGESQTIEDRLTALARVSPEADGVLADGVAETLAAIDAELARLQVPYDEWETLYRMRLQVERDLRAAKQVGEAFPAPMPVDGASSIARERRPRPGLATLVSLGGLVLLAVDAALLATDRRRDRRHVDGARVRRRRAW